MIKILLAEDDNFFRQLYSTKLEQANFKVEKVENGQEALDYLEENKPDLIVLDLIMPEKDGFEVLKVIKDKGIPVIVLSSLDHEEDIEKAKKLGANAYFQKDTLNFDKLSEKVLRLTKKENDKDK